MGCINIQYFARLCSKDETKAQVLTNTRLLHLFLCRLCFCYLFTCDSPRVYFVVLNCHISYLHILCSGNGIQASEAVFLVLFSFSLSLCSLLQHSFSMPFHPLSFILMSTSRAFSTVVSIPSNPFQRSTKPLIWFV